MTMLGFRLLANFSHRSKKMRADVALGDDLAPVIVAGTVLIIDANATPQPWDIVTISDQSIGQCSLHDEQLILSTRFPRKLTEQKITGVIVGVSVRPWKWLVDKGALAEHAWHRAMYHRWAEAKEREFYGLPPDAPVSFQRWQPDRLTWQPTFRERLRERLRTKSDQLQ